MRAGRLLAGRCLREGEHDAVVADEVFARPLRILGPGGAMVVLHAVDHTRLWQQEAMLAVGTG